MGEDYLFTLESYFQIKLDNLKNNRTELSGRISACEDALDRVQLAIDRRERTEEGGAQ